MLLHSTQAEFEPFDRGFIERRVHKLFLNQAQRSGTRLAVIDPESKLTYAELANISGCLANRVGRLAGEDDLRVALLFDQGAMYIASLLGVLQAEGTYVPLDPRRTGEWNQRILHETGCEILLCSERHLDLAQSIKPTHLVLVNADNNETQNAPMSIRSAPNALACIYSTSGTTGRAKNVCDTHRNLLHNAMRYTNTLKISRSDRLSLIQAPIFSGTQSTIFAGLLNGATIASYDVYRWGLDGLPDWIRGNGVTMFHSVPAIFRTLDKPGVEYPSVRVIRLEGDSASQRDVVVYRSHFSDGCVLVNGLAATECGLVRQYFVDKATNVEPGNLPLGYAVPDMEVVVLDTERNALPANQIGEIAVRSPFLSVGYLNQPEHTQTKYLEDGSGVRTYLTGDMGSLDAQGCLRFSGRKDQERKINGQSVSLAEVEEALVGLSGVTSAVAATRSDGENAYLVAYLVCAEHHRQPSQERIRERLAQQLPTHLRPTRIMWLEEIPLSIDGKVDRNALPPPPRERPEMVVPYVPPRDPKQQRMIRIWEEVLQIRSVGIRDDFLLLGGESLTAMQLLIRLEAELGIVISVATFFENRTVEALARIVHPERS